MSTAVDKIRSTARTPKYSGTTSGDWSAPDLGDYGYDSVGDMTQEEKSDVASHSLLGDAGADTFAELQFFPVVEPSSNNLNENALRAVISGRGAQANISASAKKSAQNKARNLLKKEFGMEEKALNKQELVPFVAKTYDVTASKALEMINTMEEVQKEMKKMEKKELIETIKKVRDGELEVSEALDNFVDVDSETIKEIKEELGGEDTTEEKETEKDTSEEDEDIEKIIDEKVEKVMEDEEIGKSKAMQKVLENDPDLYEKYKLRGV